MTNPKIDPESDSSPQLKQERREVARLWNAAGQRPRKTASKKPFPCAHCHMSFMKAQGLGGHMSRKHPGVSEKYKYKTQVRDGRVFERAKLRLAKTKFFGTFDYDYEDLVRTAAGKVRARVMMNRSQVKRLKNKIADEEVRSYISNRRPPSEQH